MNNEDDEHDWEEIGLNMNPTFINQSNSPIFKLITFQILNLLFKSYFGKSLLIINQNIDNKDSLLKNYEKEEKSIFRDWLAYLSLHDPLLNSSENDYSNNFRNNFQICFYIKDFDVFKDKNQSSNWKTLLDQSQAVNKVISIL